MDEKQYDVIILGGGPAGLTAGIYLSRTKARTLILDTGTIGGQTVLTYEVANYPGVESTSGYQLSSIMRKQALSFGCDIKSNISISDINLENDIKMVTINNNANYSARLIILATGGRSKMLNVPGETDFKGKGISYCATCDGDFFQDKEIIVVGGGNSALEEAVSLTKYASKVTILHEFDHFQAFEHAIIAAKLNPKIEFIMNSRITKFSGTDKLTRLSYSNNNTNEITEMAIDGAFIFIGYEANTNMLKNTSVELNIKGEIITNEKLQTNVDGVFAAGDNRDVRFRQITTAVADGTIAALNALEYLNRK
ncbi:MAG: FAD-dependent oxidoreductase [Bacteroidetes bacterium]|nr:FAD-dependent oxidoreductase [Bacteroidota bacterium]MBL6943701.1 FAD-dependent oxidoreductase [Bacteroidales bacterium]